MTHKKIIGAIAGCVAIAAVVLLPGKGNITKQSDIQDEAAALTPGSGVITGRLTYHGQTVNTGALVIARLKATPNPPPAIRMSNPPKPVIFSATAGADGTCSIEVYPSAKPYHLRAFYPVMDNAGNVVTHSKAASGVMVDKPGVRAEQNFSWP